MSQIVVSIREFALTGRFGPVEIGMSRQQVEELLGDPTGRGCLRRRSKEPDHLFYARYEFFFENGKLDAIQNDHLDPRWPNFVQFENDRFRVDPWILDRPVRPRLADIVTLLKEGEMPFVVGEFLARGKPVGGTVVLFESGVQLDFDEIDLDDPLPVEKTELEGIRYFPNSRLAFEKRPSVA